MKPPEMLHTERLILRTPRLSDAAAIFDAYAQDTEVTRYVVWRPHTNVQETEQYLTECIAAWSSKTRFPWVISYRSNGELLGMIELRVNSFKADVGYVVARPHWGRGIATEALRSVVEWALSQESIYRVWAVCDAENVASARVMEKAGMEREGLLRRNVLHPNAGNEPRDTYCYAIVK